MNNYDTPGLTGLLNMSTIMTPTTVLQDPAQDQQPLYSYAAGGMVGPGGAPVRPNLPGLPGLSGPSSGGLGPQQMELEARRFVQQNPEQVAEIRTTVEEALAEGDITMDQVQILTNMAKVALQNPEMYPALKQSIVARGILEEDELPPEFDQGVMFILLVIGQSMQGSAQPGLAAGGGVGSAAAPASASTPGSDQMQQPMPSMAKGGPLPAKSDAPDGSIMIKAHENEYVIPAKVVRAKGTEFFDKLLQAYADSED